ncbi:MAG: TRAP transporter substrate-binding protein [Alphaproteobacteria bacterium]
MRKILIATATAGLALAAFVTTAATAAEIKIGSFVPEKSVGVRTVIKPWLAAVQKEIGDSSKLQGYWGGTLGKSPFKQYELVKNGVADIAWVLPGYTAGQFPELQVLDLPYMASSAKEGSHAGWKLYEAGLLSGFEDTTPIGIWTAAPGHVFSSKPVASIGDLKNMKIRAIGPVHAEWIKSVGAAPQTMSSPQMNTALKRGVLDAVVQGYTGMRTFKTFSLVTHVYEAPVGVIPFILLMNKKRHESLSSAEKAAFKKWGGDTIAKWGGGAYDGETKKIRDQRLAKKDLVFADFAAEKDTGMKRAQSVHDWWIAKTPNGQKIYNTYKKALEEVRKGS